MLSNHRYMLGVISVAIASWLGGADLASGTDLAAARALGTSGPGIGEPATDPMNPSHGVARRHLFCELVYPRRPSA